MEDTFVDCPAYEQVFWVGDSRNEALVNYYVFGALDIVKRCLRLVPGFDGGAIEVEWRLDRNEMTMRVSAPEGIELDIRLPEGITGQIITVRTKQLHI
jgi:hypothetical protein